MKRNEDCLSFQVILIFLTSTLGFQEVYRVTYFQQSKMIYERTPNFHLSIETIKKLAKDIWIDFFRFLETNQNPAEIRRCLVKKQQPNFGEDIELCGVLICPGHIPFKFSRGSEEDMVYFQYRYQYSRGQNRPHSQIIVVDSFDLAYSSLKDQLKGLPLISQTWNSPRIEVGNCQKYLQEIY